jgi:hypothetical protein
MLVARRRLNGLIVDAGIGHGDAELDESGDRPPFEIEHRRGLAQQIGIGKIGAARIGNRRGPHPPLPVGGRGQSLQPSHAGLAKAFGVGHQMRLRHRHQILGAEELSDLDLVLQGLLRNEARFAGQNIFLFVVELHLDRSILNPASRTALPHFFGYIRTE